MVLTCVTDTGILDWIFGKYVTQTFFKANQIGILLNKSSFTVILHNITGENNNTSWSTATVSHHVPLNFYLVKLYLVVMAQVETSQNITSVLVRALK